MQFTLDTKIGTVDVVLAAGDLPADVSLETSAGNWVGIDTETSGLDWSSAELGLVQVYFPDRQTVYLIRPGDVVPKRLLALLASHEWSKVFHFAMFDLRFLGARWDIVASNILCTKVASKLLRPERAKHSLAELVEEYFDVTLSKLSSIRVSEWTAESLSQEQLTYAALDTVYLPLLFQRLDADLAAVGRSELARTCFSVLPAHVRADLIGVKDLFGY